MPLAGPDVSALLLATAGIAAGTAAGVLLGRTEARRRALRAEAAGSRREAERLRADATADGQRLIRVAELAAREKALVQRRGAEAALRRREVELADRRTALAAREARLGAAAEAAAQTTRRLAGRQEPLAARQQELDAAWHQVQELAAQGRAALERSAGTPAAALRDALAVAEVEEARGAAAQLLRQVSEGGASADQARRARRIMGIAAERFSGHYLTERHLSLVPLGERRSDVRPPGEDELRAIATVAGIKLSVTESGDAVRIEGLDGVGREVARRCLAHLLRRGASGGEAATTLARQVASELDREIAELGRRAFATLEIPRAHPEICNLVGRLNYRTSYTQNQWKHAVEAAFLCGMMADELRLDRRLARRAALMHDIGKALTHELDGSHAVIGADYARRLGENEVVANAIGAHHTDEPFSSPYAYLVAAADAMSGARPGARRQSEDNHMAKLADLERLTRSFPHVQEAFAVQGGREVRVYVHEDKVDDLGAVRLSSEIAAVISREMTFPGQIKITVIREFRAVETAS
jgi:ribonucrease Y